ncbi:MAG: carboxypeptidase regulatory-like domain-containing protein, partial [Verrucomicrobia bacterium]|nr:carboxypeptidase regulatory-like domain-containing protein [Verrucomicrobiota bacterium]
WATAALVLLLVGVGGWQASRSSTEGKSPEPSIHAAGSDTPTATPPPANPVPGTARLQLDVRSATTGRPLRASLWVQVFRDGELEREWESVTDGDGTAEIPVGMTGPDALVVWVSSAGHVPARGSWQGHEFAEPLLIESFRLEPGLALQGTVVNEAGQAVAGAVVQLEGPVPSPGRRQNVAFHPRWNAVTTDAAGQFRSDQLPSLLHHYLTFSVDHPEYVRATFPLEGPEAVATNRVVTLRQGLWACGRVVSGAEGLAVGDASIIAERSPGQGSRQAVADGEGRFRVGPFASGALTLAVQSPGLAASRFRIELSPDSKEFVLYLPSDLPAAGVPQSPAKAGPMVRLTGRVTDRESGAPVPRFRVRLIEPGSDTRLLGEGVDGQFDWAIRMGSHPEFQLEVAAEDYRTVSSEVRSVSEVEQEFSVELDPGKGITGWVVEGQGKPVTGAFVGLNHGGYHSESGGRPGDLEALAHHFEMENGGRLRNANSGYRTLTDRDGRFSFPPTPHAESVLIVAPEGCSQVPVTGLEERKISLQAWGAIEGTWVRDGKPCADQLMLLRDWIPTGDQTPPGIRLDMYAHTDGQGRFRFPRVPAGLMELLGASGRPNQEEYSHPTWVTVTAGSVTEVELVQDGPPVIGRLRASENLPDHRWEMDEVVLRREVPDEPPPHARDERVWTRAMLTSRHASAIPGPEGSLRFPSVAPGRYRLEAWLRAPLEVGSESGHYRILGHLSLAVTVPEITGEESRESPFDLGVLEVPLNGAPQPPR